MRRFVLALLAAGGVTGCGAPADRPMPLAAGHRWTYNVTLDFQSAVHEVRVVGSIPVDGRAGWRLSSPMGESRLAWEDGTLYASELAGTRYTPAIPVFAASDRAWSGVLTSPAGSAEATARLSMTQQVEEPIRIGGRDFRVSLAQLDVVTPDGRVEVQTWHSDGVGIVRQEQRTDGRRTMRLDYVDGP